MGVDPSAHVFNCEIGEGSRVCQFASLRNVRLGRDCVVWPFVMLDGPTFGDRCIVASGVAMGPGFVIGNDVFVGPNVVFCNDAWPRVSKDSFDPKDGVSVYVKDGASIGANATLLPGVVIGRNAMVAAGSVAKISVPDNHLLDRNGDVRPIRPEWRERRMRFV